MTTEELRKLSRLLTKYELEIDTISQVGEKTIIKQAHEVVDRNINQCEFLEYYNINKQAIIKNGVPKLL